VVLPSLAPVAMADLRQSGGSRSRPEDQSAVPVKSLTVHGPFAEVAIQKAEADAHRKFRDAHTPGLQWEDIGPHKPACGTEIGNLALRVSLTKGQTKFTERALAKLGLENLTFDDYILVETGQSKQKAYFRPVSRYTSDERMADFNKLVSAGHNQQRAAKLAEVRAAAASRVFGGVGVQTEILENLDSDLGIRVAELEDALATSMRVLEAPNKRNGRQQGEQNGIQDKQGRQRSREGNEGTKQQEECMLRPDLWPEQPMEGRDSDFTSRRHVVIAGKGLQDFSLVDMEQTRIKGMPSARRAHTSPRKSRSGSPSKSRTAPNVSPAQRGAEDVVPGGFEMLRRKGQVTPRKARTPRTPRSSRKSADRAARATDGGIGGGGGDATAATARGGDGRAPGRQMRKGVRTPSTAPGWMPRETRIWNDAIFQELLDPSFQLSLAAPSVSHDGPKPPLPWRPPQDWKLQAMTSPSLPWRPPQDILGVCAYDH
jgi:hypothetical protein